MLTLNLRNGRNRFSTKSREAVTTTVLIYCRSDTEAAGSAGGKPSEGALISPNASAVSLSSASYQYPQLSGTNASSRRRTHKQAGTEPERKAVQVQRADSLREFRMRAVNQCIIEPNEAE